MNKLAIAMCLVGGLAFTAQAQTTPPPKKEQPKKPETKPAAPGGATGAATGTPAGAPAGAAGGTTPAPPTPPKPGPETEALKTFTKNVTWTGKVPAGAYGNNPELPSKGKATCKWILNNLWAACDMEDTQGTGKQAVTWKGHWVYGWDFEAKEYRGTMTDSFGATVPMKGKLDGPKLTWESVSETTMMGQPTKIRITMDATDPKAVKFTGEHTQGKNYVVDEETVMKPSGK